MPQTQDVTAMICINCIQFSVVLQYLNDLNIMTLKLSKILIRTHTPDNTKCEADDHSADIDQGPQPYTPWCQ